MIHKSSSPFRKRCTFFGSFSIFVVSLQDLAGQNFHFNQWMTGPSAESVAGLSVRGTSLSFMYSPKGMPWGVAPFVADPPQRNSSTTQIHVMAP